MTLLAIGVLLFAGLHLIKSLAPELRAACLAKLGDGGYKGVFSLLLLGSIALIVIGWRSSVPQFIYMPVPGLHSLAMALILLAFLLLVVSSRPSRLRQLVRHPQLSGVLLWGCAHLLLNGDSRSVLLFGGLALWALAEIFAINRRDGVWIKDEPPGLAADAVNLVITVVVVAAVVYIHPWLAGVTITGHLPQ